MKKRQKEVELQHLQAQEDALRAKFDELEWALKERAGETDCDLARQAGADLLWQQWADSRKNAITGERARLKPFLQRARQDLVNEFGRSQALEKLTQTHLAQLAQDRKRRADRD